MISTIPIYMFITKSISNNIQSNLRQRASSYIQSVCDSLIKTKCILPSLWVVCVYVPFPDVSLQLIKVQAYFIS